MAGTCPSEKYSRSKKKDPNRLAGSSGKLRSKGKYVLEDNVRGRGDRYQQVFVQAAATTLARYKDTAAKNWGKGAKPYKNEAHHVLITELVTEWRWDDLGNSWILEEGEWDQNNGENNIFLPKKPKDVAIHLLPLHDGAHKANYPKDFSNVQYRRDIKAILKKLREEFKKADPCEKDTNNYTKVQTQLNNDADVLWRKLATCEYGADIGLASRRTPQERAQLNALESQAKKPGTIKDWGNPAATYGPASYQA